MNTMIFKKLLWEIFNNEYIRFGVCPRYWFCRRSFLDPLVPANQAEAKTAFKRDCERRPNDVETNNGSVGIYVAKNKEKLKDITKFVVGQVSEGSKQSRDLPNAERVKMLDFVQTGYWLNISYAC